VSNDAGTIMRQINRTRKPCVGVRDIAIVGFEIGPDGRMASATILQSSGEPAIIKQHLTTCERQPHFPPAVRRRAFVSG
jgi:outer membrane biosynthesis protein TonB